MFRGELRRTNQVDVGLRTYKEWLEDWGSRRDMMAIFKYPNSCHVRDEAELFGIITDNREEALDLHHKSN